MPDAKSVPMLPANAAPTPNDLIYVLKAALGNDRDTSMTLAGLLKAFLTSSFNDDPGGLGTIPWNGDTPSGTYVPSYRYTYQTGTLLQGFTNLQEVVGDLKSAAATWTLSANTEYTIDPDMSGNVYVYVDDVPVSSKVYTIVGDLKDERSMFFFVKEKVLPFPCTIVHDGTTLATIRGGELVHVIWLGGAPYATVIGAAERTLLSLKAWGGADERNLALLDDSLTSLFKVVKGGVQLQGKAGLQALRRSTAQLEAIGTGGEYAYAHYLPHTDGMLYERIPVVNWSNDVTGVVWLGTTFTERKIAAEAHAGGPWTALPLTTSWLDVARRVQSFNVDSDTGLEWLQPTMPTEVFVALKLSTGAELNGYGMNTTRSNIKARLVWEDGTWWEGSIVSTYREQGGGAPATWTFRFNGRRSDLNGLVVPKNLDSPSPSPAWSGGEIPSCSLQLSLAAGTATTTAPIAAAFMFRMRPRLVKDYGHND